MKFNSQFEDVEQQNPELIHDLQEIYQMTAEDKEALARIEARLTRSVPRQHLELDSPSSSSQPGNITPITHSRPSTKKLWQQHMGLIAALLAIVLITGAIVSTFVLMKGNSLIATPVKPNPTSQPIGIPIPPNKDTWKSDSFHLGFIMFTEQAGWAGPAYASQDPVRRTTDGGKSWKQIVLPQELSEKYFRVYAFDKDTLLIQPINPAGAGDPLLYFYRTVDAGGTWQRYNWPTTPEMDQAGYGTIRWTFLDTMHGWVKISQAISHGSPNPPSPEQKLFRTDDGGKTWEQIAVLPFKYQVWITFIDAQTGWLTTIIDVPEDNPFAHVLYVTHDGGRTWKQSSLPIPPQGAEKLDYMQVPIFSSKQEGYVFASYTIQGDSTTNEYLFTTQDGGNSWQISGTALPESEIFHFWTVVDAEHIVNEQFLFTLSNGQWVKTSSPPPASSEQDTRIRFLSAQVGMALVDDTILYKTNDGGKTWQKVSTLPKGM